MPKRQFKKLRMIAVAMGSSIVAILATVASVLADTTPGDFP
jgi:hypothetical protein